MKKLDTLKTGIRKMNEINEFLARLNGWKKCNPPKWFNEFRLRQRIGFPKIFHLKGKTFRYKAFKKQHEQQGNGFNTIYQFYKKRRRRNSGIRWKGKPLYRVEGRVYWKGIAVDDDEFEVVRINPKELKQYNYWVKKLNRRKRR